MVTRVSQIVQSSSGKSAVMRQTRGQARKSVQESKVRINKGGMRISIMKPGQRPRPSTRLKGSSWGKEEICESSHCFLMHFAVFMKGRSKVTWLHHIRADKHMQLNP